MYSLGQLFIVLNGQILQNQFGHLVTLTGILDATLGSMPSNGESFRAKNHLMMDRTEQKNEHQSSSFVKFYRGVRKIPPFR